MMINPSTGWFNMAQIPNKAAVEISDITKTKLVHSLPTSTVNCVWLRYRIYGWIFQDLSKLLWPKKENITTRNPQPNAVIKQIHQIIGNIIRTFDVSNIVDNNPWLGILAATMFAVRTNYHTTLQASPVQLVFGQDAIVARNYIFCLIWRFYVPKRDILEYWGTIIYYWWPYYILSKDKGL